MDPVCYTVYGVGAAERTTCGSGQSCIQGQCVNDPLAPTGNCLYGDDYVFNTDFPSNLITLPSTFTTCNTVISYLTSIKADFVYYCQNKVFNFASSCCQTCASELTDFKFN